MTEPISALTDHLGYWVRQVSNHVSQAFARKLADRDITVAEWAVMRVMHGREALAPSRIAGDMGMTRGAITKLADRLITKELVVREASDGDARAQTLRLTSRAVHCMPELAALADRNDLECFGHLSEEERRSLQAILRKTVVGLGISTVPTT